MGKASARLRQGRVCSVGRNAAQERQGFCLPSHRSRAQPLLFTGKLSLKSGVAPAPLTFPGAGGGESLSPTSSLLAAAALAARRGCLPPAELERS